MKKVSPPLGLLACTLAMACLLSACQSKSADDVPPSDSSATGESASSTEDIFEFDDNTVVMGSLQHAPAGYTADELTTLSDNPIQIIYNGTECSLEYQVTATGNAKDVGFFLLLDDEPIPYKVGDSTAEYEYCHTFHLEEDNEPYVFTIFFTPVGGLSGESKTLKLASVYNPEYHPDMVKSSNYGFYHDIVTGLNCYRVDYQTDAPVAESLPLVPQTCITHLSQTTSVITSSFLSTDWVNGGTIQEDLLDTTVRQQMTINGSETAVTENNLSCAGQENIQVRLYLCGVPGMTYKTIFFLNHQPIANDDGQYAYTTSLEKGVVTEICFDLPTSSVGDGATFYALSLPCNYTDFPNLGLDMPLRTSSIYLYN